MIDGRRLAAIFVGAVIWYGGFAYAATSIELPLLSFERVELRLYGERAYFVVDTGADISYLDLKYKGLLGLPTERVTQMSAISTDSNVAVYCGPELLIGKARFQPKLVGCVDMTGARMVSGELCDGILGMNVLSRHVITFDPDKHLFSIGDRVAPEIKSRAAVVPLRTNDFALPGVVNETARISVIIDSGANDFLALCARDWRRVFPDGETNAAKAPMIGLGGQLDQDTQVRLKSFAIGTNIYTNVIAGRLMNPDLPSVLGSEFLKQHVATIDYPNHLLYFARGRQFGQPQEANMSGLHLLRIEGKTVVHSVDPHSPAFEAGLRARDSIISLNHKQAASMSMIEIREMLKEKDGKEITVEADHQGNIKEFKFRLKRQI